MLPFGHPGLAKARKMWLTAPHQSRVPEAGPDSTIGSRRSIEMTFNRMLLAGIGDRRGSEPASAHHSG